MLKYYFLYVFSAACWHRKLYRSKEVTFWPILKGNVIGMISCPLKCYSTERLTLVRESYIQNGEFVELFWII